MDIFSQVKDGAITAYMQFIYVPGYLGQAWPSGNEKVSILLPQCFAPGIIHIYHVYIHLGVGLVF